MDITIEIIEFIRANRVSTTEVADALGKSGVLADILPITPGKLHVGRVRALFTANDSNYDLHEQCKHVEKGEVVIVFTHACNERAIFGDLVARFLTLYKGAEAVVVDGKVRDVSRLRRETYPIWAKGVTPLGCFNVSAEPFPPEKVAAIRKQVDGGIAVCDDGGVVVIPRDQLNESMLARLHQIEDQEDIWYYCLNALKWDTKKIVCDKGYLAEDILPQVFIEKLAKMKKPLDSKKEGE